MVAIYVQKSWLKTIGRVANLLLTQDEDGDYISFLAGKVEINFPFVETKVARKEGEDTDNIFLPLKIPVGVISGIFDLTRKEVSKYGFHETEKMRD